MNDSTFHLHMATIATQQTAIAQQQSAHAAAQFYTRPLHKLGITLVLLHDRTIGALPDHLVSIFRMNTNARDVRIAASTQRHILERRQIIHQDDVALCLDRLAEALANIRFVASTQRDPHVWELIGTVPSCGRHIMLPLKLVQTTFGEAAADELWLRTAHPCGTNTLRRRVARGTVVPVSAV